MQKETDPLNLGSLPAMAPPADGWPVIRAELEQHNRRRQPRRLTGYGASALAIAATVILAVGMYVQQPIVLPVEAAPQALDSLVRLSQKLENRVRTYRSEMGRMPTNTLVYQVELEDLIAQVDEELSMTPDSPELWGRRVNLLLDLSRLYQNQLRRDYRHMASL